MLRFCAPNAADGSVHRDLPVPKAPPSQHRVVTITSKETAEDLGMSCADLARMQSVCKALGLSVVRVAVPTAAIKMACDYATRITDPDFVKEHGFQARPSRICPWVPPLALIWPTTPPLATRWTRVGRARI